MTATVTEPDITEVVDFDSEITCERDTDCLSGNGPATHIMILSCHNHFICTACMFEWLTGPYVVVGCRHCGKDHDRSQVTVRPL